MRTTTRPLTSLLGVATLAGATALGTLGAGMPAAGAQTIEVPAFLCTGSAQEWVVPDGVTEATFEVVGAEGGKQNPQEGGFGGRGASVTATIPVTPGETIQVNVGCKGGDGVSTGTGGDGGYIGGGDGGDNAAGAGGGASDIRQSGTSAADRVIVAGGGGGGGAGGAAGSDGGDGGQIGEDGDSSSSGGATGGQSGGNGGAGGTAAAGTALPGDPGLPDGTGGAGGAGNAGEQGSGVGGGGGGGGFVGGGGGGGGQLSLSFGGGGGGGSSTGPAGAVFEDGVRTGDGVILITYLQPVPPAPPTPVPDAIVVEPTFTG